MTLGNALAQNNSANGASVLTNEIVHRRAQPENFIIGMGYNDENTFICQS
jgi:hypothetical protein